MAAPRRDEPAGRTTSSDRPHVLVLGGGFGGIGAARELLDADVDVTVVDRHDYYTFQPLLYQVATLVGVPFFIRTGKHLPATQTEVRLVFKRPPKLGFGFTGDRLPEPVQLIIKLDPSTGIRLCVDARRADADGPETITLDMEFADEGGEGATPYEVLLHAALLGQSTRFTRQDGVEETWRIMQPLLDAPPPVHPYPPGSWGPSAADAVVDGFGTWQQPWVTS